MSSLNGAAMNNRHSADEEILQRLSKDNEDANRRLHARLVQAAQMSNVLDIAYGTVETPVGVLLLAATERGLVRVAYPSQNHELVLEQLAAEISPRILHAPDRLQDASRQLDEYFAGRRRQFSLELDNRMSPGFRRSVLVRLQSIAYGSTVSYAELANMAGNPKAVRAVGTACGANPLPVVVPCHRIVRSDGTPGGYVGGAEAKQTLLKLEGAA
ncbi:MAG TPA: methylated-DNA--[protein]-cysteine S-methyltransferase [Arthrobacter sp.]|nr:methylated-DNA--[protein]-cysteine S-methyltransferase [Arthrobacter sp.]